MIIPFLLKGATIRQVPQIYLQYKQNTDNSNLINYKKELEYKYYKCDYCDNKIIILNKQNEMSGGIVDLPATLTKKGVIKLALCNKCLKPVLNDIEKYYEEERK